MNGEAGIDIVISGERYISLDVFVGKYLGTNNLFQGYVIGYGYVKIVQRVISPSHLNGQSSETPMVSLGESSFTLVSEMRPDQSPEAIKKSLKGLFVNGQATITVKAGMTLSGIASLFNVTVDELMRWNNIENPDKIVVGQKITIQSKGKEEGDLLKDVMGYVGYANLIPTIASGMKYTGNVRIFGIEGFWRGVNGKYYKLSQASPSSGRGWNFRANSARIASSSSKWLRLGGNVVSYVTTGYSAYCFVKDPNWEDGFDTGFGIAGAIYWPIGVAYTNVKLNVAIMPSVIDYNIERAERIAKGDWSMAFWTYGRSVR